MGKLIWLGLLFAVLGFGAGMALSYYVLNPPLEVYDRCKVYCCEDGMVIRDDIAVFKAKSVQAAPSAHPKANGMIAR